MYSFLSKIRRTLIGTGLSKKYFLYAIGEILLVMIGILLALQVNNWNEERAKRQNVNVQLQNLSLAVKENIRMLDFHKDANERRFYSWQHILKYSKNDSLGLSNIPWTDDKRGTWKKPKPIDQNEEFINVGILDLSWAFAPPPLDMTAVNEMKNTGLFSEIQHEELKGAINRFYFLLELELGDINNKMSYELAQELGRHLRNHYGISTFNTSDASTVLEAFENDQSAHVMLKDLIFAAHAQYHGVVSLIERAESLLVSIESEVTQI